MDHLKEQIQELPDQPGVYFFKTDQEILYIGKATSLRDRVRSYFRGDLATTRSGWIAKMITQVTAVAYQQTDSVLEALILEAAEIKKHQPPYNTREKDDKSYLYVVITDEDFPRVLIVRGKDLDKNLPRRYTYGPFPYASELRAAIKIIRRIFPFRDTCLPAEASAKAGKPIRPCFNAQIGLCPGVCSGEINRTDYSKIIRNLKLFFEGKKVQVIKNLEREMREAAKDQHFEEAAKAKHQIFALTHIQDVALIKKNTGFQVPSAKFRMEAYDVAHLGGTHTVGVMIVGDNHSLLKTDYRKFKLRGSSANKADDVNNLREVLERRFTHPEWPWPHAIILDGAQAQLNVAQAVLTKLGLEIPVIAVTKDAHHRARNVTGPKTLTERHRDQIVRLNAEAHRFALAYHRARRGRMV